LATVKNCELYRFNYARPVGRHGIKMKALLLGVQSKLLKLMHILYKVESIFDKEYKEKKRLCQG